MLAVFQEVRQHKCSFIAGLLSFHKIQVREGLQQSTCDQRSEG